MTDIEYLMMKEYMQYLIILEKGNGILKLEHISKLVDKSYSQITRDIKKLETLKLIKISVLETRHKVVVMSRKTYKNIFLVDKRIKNNNSYNIRDLEKNFIKAYIYTKYNFDNHEYIRTYLDYKYFYNTSNSFKSKNKDIFNIFNNKDILFYEYEESLNIVRVIISYHSINKENIKGLMYKLEGIYRLFYMLGLDDIDIDLSIVTYKNCDKSYILNNIKNNKTKDKYYKSSKFEEILNRNFFGSIDVNSLEDIY